MDRLKRVKIGYINCFWVIGNLFKLNWESYVNLNLPWNNNVLSLFIIKGIIVIDREYRWI